MHGEQTIPIGAHQSAHSEKKAIPRLATQLHCDERARKHTHAHTGKRQHTHIHTPRAAFRQKGTTIQLCCVGARTAASRARPLAHMLAPFPHRKKTTPRIHAHTRTGRWDGEIVVLPQGCVGPAHLAAFHVHLCVRAERLLHALCSNMGSPWSAEHVLSCSTFDEQPRASTSAAISFADARAQAWDGSIIDAAARQWGGVADKLVCSLMALIHLDGGERNGGGGRGEEPSANHVFLPPCLPSSSLLPKTLPHQACSSTPCAHDRCPAKKKHTHTQDPRRAHQSWQAFGCTRAPRTRAAPSWAPP